MTGITNTIAVKANEPITESKIAIGDNILFGSTVGDEANPDYIKADYIKVSNDTTDYYIANIDMYIGFSAGITRNVDPNLDPDVETLYGGVTGTNIDRATKRRTDVMFADNRGFFSINPAPAVTDDNGKYNVYYDTSNGYGYGAFYFRPTAVKKENLSKLPGGDSLNAFKKGALIGVSNWYIDDDNFITYVIFNGEYNFNITEDDFVTITPNLNLKNSNFLQDEVPTSATSPGTKGATAFDRNYMYHCYANNQWTRFARDLSW